MKLRGMDVERCALCGSWPTAVSEVGGQTYCACIRCKHESRAVETGPDINAAVAEAIEAWNLEMRKQ